MEVGDNTKGSAERSRTPAGAGDRRMTQKGSAGGPKLLVQRAGFLNELPRSVPGADRGSSPKKGSLRTEADVPSSFLRPSAAARSAVLERSAVPSLVKRPGRDADTARTGMATSRRWCRGSPITKYLGMRPSDLGSA